MLFHNVLRNLFAHSTSRLVYFDKPQYRQAEHFAGIGEKAATIEDADMTELEKLGVVTYEKPHENAQGLVAFLMEQMKEKTDLSEKKRLAIALNFASIISLHFDPHSMRKDDKIEFDIDSAGIGCKASVNGTDYEIDLSQTYRDIDPSTLTQVSDATRDSLKGTAAEVLAKARIPYDAIVSVRGKFSWDQYKKDFQALQRLGLADASHDAALIKKDVQDGGGADLAKLRKIGTEFLKAVKKLANDEGGDLGKVKAKLDGPAPAPAPAPSTLDAYPTLKGTDLHGLAASYVRAGDNPKLRTLEQIVLRPALHGRILTGAGMDVTYRYAATGKPNEYLPVAIGGDGHLEITVVKNSFRDVVAVDASYAPDHIDELIAAKVTELEAR